MFPSVFDDSTIVSPVQGLELRLLYAAWAGDIAKLQELLEQGCPIDAQNEVSHIGGVSFQLWSIADVACFLVPVVHCPFS